MRGIRVGLVFLGLLQCGKGQLPSSLPTVTPTIEDPKAPNPQTECPGYKAFNVATSSKGLSADLTIAGQRCNVFGSDIVDLVLDVTYQTEDRLNVKFRPKYIGAANSSWFVLDDQFVKLPGGQISSGDSHLEFKWSNNPSFQFSVSRAKNGEELFSTFGNKIVYEDQFLELKTQMVRDYNIYGLAENIHNLRLGTNFNQSLFNADDADALNANSYGTHPFFIETRWSGNGSSTHGMWIRNAHAQEWLLQETSLTYRTIGGDLDLYFFSGESSSPPRGFGGQNNETRHGGQSTALEVFRQYQNAVGLPAMQMYWTFGFHQCHWGWLEVSDLEETVANYSAAGIPLEAIWNDIDLYQGFRVFTNDPIRYPASRMHDFVDHLHGRGQHYIALQDSNIYIPNATNASDVASYPQYTRGQQQNAFVRDANTTDVYVGSAWPGFSVWADWFNPKAEPYWISEIEQWHVNVPFDGLWVDLNEVESFCSYSCGDSALLNSTSNSTRPLHNLTSVRNLDHPPYKINNTKPSRQLDDTTMALSAYHNDAQHTREYDVHNLWSVGSAMATMSALSSIFPGKRPFLIMRSSFSGTGRFAGNWGGDNESKWGAMFLSISQALTFMMSGIPMFGTDACGFSNSVAPTEELCARWMELNAFFPFYRNHYAIDKAQQEAYIWPSVAEATRRVISVRYSLLTYLYTLFYFAHTQGDLVLRALAWEFPNDATLRAVDTQFMFGPSLLVTPVLAPGLTTVNGVFPGVGQGERWYDWYTLAEVHARPQENVTMPAPLEHINLHVRGGSILPLQEPGNTTASTRENRYSLLVAANNHDSASGSLYLDDGESVSPNATKMVQFSYDRGRLTARPSGNYHAAPALANITVAGIRRPRNVELIVGKNRTANLPISYSAGVLRVANLANYTAAGAWESELVLLIR